MNKVFKVKAARVQDFACKTVTIADNAQAPRYAAGDAVKVKHLLVEPGDAIYRDGITKQAREPG